MSILSRFLRPHISTETPQETAAERLERMVRANYYAPATVAFREKRRAAKLGWARKQAHG